MRSLSLFVLVLALASCDSASVTKYETSKSHGAQDGKEVLPNTSQKSKLRHASDELAQRVLVYEDARRKAREVGMLSGAIRGTLLGALVGGEGGALAGALLGASVGVIASDYTADGLIKEHQNYLISRRTIDAVIEAAKKDTINLEKDVAVVRNLSDVIAEERDIGNVTGGELIDQVVKDNALKIEEVSQDKVSSLNQVIAMMEVNGMQNPTLESQLRYQEGLNRQLKNLVEEVVQSR